MKIKMEASFGYVGAVHKGTAEIGEEKISGMSDAEIDEYIMENYVEPFAHEYLDMGYEIVED